MQPFDGCRLTKTTEGASEPRLPEAQLGPESNSLGPKEWSDARARVGVTARAHEHGPREHASHVTGALLTSQGEKTRHVLEQKKNKKSSAPQKQPKNH